MTHEFMRQLEDRYDAVSWVEDADIHDVEDYDHARELQGDVAASLAEVNRLAELGSGYESEYLHAFAYAVNAMEALADLMPEPIL